MSELLRVERLSVSFGSGPRQVQAVREFSFVLYRGETLVLAGESGSGKTVATLALTRVVPSRGVRISGSCLYGGRDLLSLDESALCRVRGGMIAYVFQEPAAFLNPLFRIAEQVAEPLVRHKGMTRSAARAEALCLLEKVRLADPRRVADSYPHQLSGGMNQRVMAAIAIACGPGLLIADEPTTSLDVTTERELLDLFTALKMELGFSLLFITHNLSIARRIADRVMVMYQGALVEEGTREAVFGSPRHEHTRKLIAAYEKIGKP